MPEEITPWDHLVEIVKMSNSGDQDGVIKYVDKHNDEITGQVLSATLNCIELTPAFVSAHKNVLQKIADPKVELDLRDSFRMGLLIKLLNDN